MAALSLAALPAAACAADVTVTVNVRTAAGAPIPDAPIQVYSDAAAEFGFTDQHGTVSFTIPLPQDDPDIVARLWDGAFHAAELTPDERVLAAAQYVSLPETYRFSPYYFAQAVAGQTQYQIDITGQPAVQATGRLVDAQGDGIEDFSFAWIRGGLWFGEFENGADLFTIHGIPEGATAELWLGVSTPQTHVVELTAAQTAQDFDLGNVVVQTADRPVPLEMTVSNAEDLYDPGDIPLWDQVSLIRDDAEVLLTFPVKPPDGEVVADVVAIQTDVPRTTAGLYYVVPGGINSPTALALLDAIRAGQQAQLDAAGVPKFTAVEGQTTQFTLDATAARNAILAATGQAP